MNTEEYCQVVECLCILTIFIFKSAVAFFFLFFLHGTSIGNGQQGISYNEQVFAKGWNSSTSDQKQQMPGFANG